jgi:uncharacterized peroxidase-related enzyme
MANVKNDRAAWIATARADDLPDVVDQLIRPTAERIGFVPNVTRLLGVSPSHYVNWWRYFEDLMTGPSNLTRIQREMMAVVISAESGCPYCTIAHASSLRLQTEDPALVDRLMTNYRHVDLEPQDRAMLDFAVKLTKTPDQCEAVDITLLRQAGFGDEDILHIIEVTAIFNYNVRLAGATGLSPNPEYHEIGRSGSGRAG